MMPETVRYLASGQRLMVAALFRFEFLSRTMRFWDGVRELTAGGQVWEGSSDVISVSGMGHSRNMSAQQVTFTLSGATGELIQFAAGNQQEVTNRPCAVFLQFLAEDRSTLDNPFAVWSGNMDTMGFSVGGDSQQIQLTAETLFVSRIRAPYAYQTDRDQQARWPGDTGFQFMPLLRNKTVPWLRG
jgi:hypothetical protein